MELALMVGSRTKTKQKTAQAILQNTLDCIRERLAAGESVELRNFGKFQVWTRKGSVGRNPKQPEEAIRYPDCKVVRFKPGKKMREAVL